MPTKKLPAALRKKLKSATALGRLPDTDDDGRDDANDLIDALTGLSPREAESMDRNVRRRVLSLVDLWISVLCDGLVVGVAVNRPKLARAAAEAATAFGLRKPAQMLGKVAECIPPNVGRMKDELARFDWYEVGPGRPLAKKLERLEQKITDDDEFGQATLWACLKQMEAHPEEFFKR